MGSDTSRLQELFPELQAAFDTGHASEAAAAAAATSCDQTGNLPSVKDGEAAGEAAPAQATITSGPFEQGDQRRCVEAVTQAFSEQLCVSGRALASAADAATGPPAPMPGRSDSCVTHCMAPEAARQTEICSTAGHAAGVDKLPKLGTHLGAPSVAELVAAAAAARQQGCDAAAVGAAAEPFYQGGGEHAAVESMVSTSAGSCCMQTADCHVAAQTLK
jgi:hypothetical protein